MTSLSAFSKTEEQTDGEVGEKKQTGDRLERFRRLLCYTERNRGKNFFTAIGNLRGQRLFCLRSGRKRVRHLDTRTLKEFSGVIKEMSGVAKELFGSEDDAGETLRVEFSDDAFDCGG